MHVTLPRISRRVRKGKARPREVARKAVIGQCRELLHLDHLQGTKGYSK